MHYAVIVALSKEVGHDGIIIVNENLSRLLEMIQSEKDDNDLFFNMINRLILIKKDQKLEQAQEFAIDCILEEIVLFQKTLQL